MICEEGNFMVINVATETAVLSRALLLARSDEPARFVFQFDVRLWVERRPSTGFWRKAEMRYRTDTKLNECAVFGTSSVDVPSLIAAIRDLETLALRRISWGRRRPLELDRTKDG
jgi:hypothetical protein